MKWAFTVPGNPQPWMRVERARDGHGYVKPEMADFQQKVSLCARAAGIRATRHAVEVAVVAYLPIHPLANGAGDWDNYAKNVCDALNGVAWEDDRQVLTGVGTKRMDVDNPRTEVLIRVVQMMDLPPAPPLQRKRAKGPVPAYTPPKS